MSGRGEGGGYPLNRWKGAELTVSRKAPAFFSPSAVKCVFECVLQLTEYRPPSDIQICTYMYSIYGAPCTSKDQ